MLICLSYATYDQNNISWLHFRPIYKHFFKIFICIYNYIRKLFCHNNFNVFTIQKTKQKSDLSEFTSSRHLYSNSFRITKYSSIYQFIFYLLSLFYFYFIFSLLLLCTRHCVSKETYVMYSISTTHNTILTAFVSLLDTGDDTKSTLIH